MPRTVYQYLLVPTAQFEQQPNQLHGFLDMLRYNRANVVEVSSGYVILCTTHPGGFTLARWNSFGIYPVGPVTSSTGDDLGAYHDLVVEYGERIQARAPRVTVREGTTVVPSGARNDFLFKATSELRGQGVTGDELFRQVAQLNRERCDPPLSADHVARVVKSVEWKLTKETRG